MKIVYEGFAEYDGERYPIHIDPESLAFSLDPLVEGQDRLVYYSPEEIQEAIRPYVQEAEALKKKPPENSSTPQLILHPQAWLITAMDNYRSVTVRGLDKRLLNTVRVIYQDGSKGIVSIHALRIGSEYDIKHGIALGRKAVDAHEAYRSEKRQWYYSHLVKKHEVEIRDAQENTVLVYEKGWTATFPGAHKLLKFPADITPLGVIQQLCRTILVKHYPYTLDKEGKVVGRDSESFAYHYFPDEETAQGVADLRAADGSAEKAIIEWNDKHAYTFG